jgi:tetratricopeptide (TPR) repeat protein
MGEIQVMGAASSEGLGISPSLQRLIEHPKPVTFSGLWKALSPPDRELAAGALLATKPSEQLRLAHEVARARNFRIQTVRKWPMAKLCGRMRSVAVRDQDLATGLIKAFHLEHRSEMLGQFLDGLGISHENGLAEEFDDDPRDVETIAGLASVLHKRFGGDHVVTYFLALIAQEVAIEPALWDWLLRPRESLPSAVSAQTPPLEEESALESEDPDDPARHVSFTTLDRVLVFAAVDAAQGVVGALDEDEIDDAVDELLQLNGRRHHSYFHAGFRDVLFDRMLSEELPAQNVERARWYWAGAIQGWARSEAWRSIVHNYDERSTVRSLGDGQDGASIAAVRHVAQALSVEGRASDIAHFVSVEALGVAPRLVPMLLQVGTELLRLGEPGAARPILDLLMKGLPGLEANGLPKFHPLVLEVMRRQAHCMRQLQEHLKARELLEELLELEPDPNHQAMIHADLGLLAGGFNRLVDVVLPREQASLDIVLGALDAGVHHFERAIESEVPYAAHGHYCMGVMRLGEDRVEEAEVHLERARARLRGQKDRYSTELLSRVDLYFGIAKAQTLFEDRMAHASKVIIDGLEGGAVFPPYLIRTTVEALSECGEEIDLCAVAEELLSSGGNAAMDALANTDAVLSCAPLVSALHGRSQANGRRSEDRASDLRAALRGYVTSGDADTAAEALDALEELAAAGVGVDEFTELLTHPDRYEPGWDRDEATVARARCFEVQGEYVEATDVLRPLFHQYATDDDLLDAEGVLDRIEAYGILREVHDDMSRRMAALREHASLSGRAESAVPGGRDTLRVLVVGGSEPQARVEEPVRLALAESHPHIEVTFIRTGWSGNWSKAADDIQRAIPDHDALVVMRFIRTGLGRSARRNCPIPWRFCWGAGRALMVSSILAAAEASASA